jgi:hypothetical protein
MSEGLGNKQLLPSAQATRRALAISRPHASLTFCTRVQGTSDVSEPSRGLVWGAKAAEEAVRVR